LDICTSGVCSENTSFSSNLKRNIVVEVVVVAVDVGKEVETEAIPWKRGKNKITLTVSSITRTSFQLSLSFVKSPPFNSIPFSCILGV